MAVKVGCYIFFLSAFFFFEDSIFSFILHPTLDLHIE